ncbi:MFS transporter [Sporolituus thermophilus]|uniref:MFS transporter, DHA1 family, multidrug resistance protein n=1 Tax=Sporolituus thermophilus DSM 23256 TaxID=1123285 RepID=A0A1G7L9J1_9FIRM|nr:MFS transporter [Sporolituus thermophilus]SDF46197.1 MFS transporter, DHA1 family, multidrug resistance protein [Sporolituus thermophilus DSM 23256]
MNWRKNLWTLWVGCIISGSCYTMLLPFLPLYLYDLGTPAATISLWSGLIFAATFFVSTIMSPFWGRQADKAGKKLMLLRAGFSLATVYLLGAFVTSPLQLFGVRLLQGFATGFVPAALAIVSASVPEEKMGFSLGLMQAATLTGSIIGPLFGGLLAHYFGIRMSFVVAAAAMLFGTMAVGLLVKEPARSGEVQSGSMVNDIKISLNNRGLCIALFLMLITQMVVMLLQPLITLHVAALQGRMEGAVLTSGVIFSLAGIAGAIAAPLWGRVGQKVGLGKILVVVFTGAGIFNGSLFFTETIWGFALLQFLFGLFIAGIQPTANTMAVFNSDAAFRGRAFGLMMSASQLGSMLGPLLGGIISTWIGIKLTFLYAGLFLISMGILLWSRYNWGNIRVSARQSSSM